MTANRLRTRVLSAWSIVVVIAASALGQEKSATGTLGTIERKDPRIDRLIPSEARLEKLAEGFDWSEGPAWFKKDGFLVFSDVPRNTVFQWKEGQGIKVFLKPSGYTGSTPRGGEPGSNGLLVDPDGRLLLCQHGDRRVSRLEPDGSFHVMADNYQGKRFNSPNDLVMKSNGDIYFTDPPYGLLKNNADPAKEIPFNGVYRIARNGTVTLLTKEMTFPNGLAFSPDEKTLYVANSDAKLPIWKAFPVKDDGTLGEGRVFFDAAPLAKMGKKGMPDGMKVDREGNLFATGPGGVVVLSPDATHLGTIDTGEATANCGWGEDGSTLFVTADMYLCRIRLTTRGAGF
jgi:gluconolactonase